LTNGPAELAERKVVELRQKLAGIGAEFDEWLKDAGPDMPLRKHQSQIERLKGQLCGMAGAIETRIDQLSGSPDDILGGCRTLQARMLEVHRLWDYFRSKLSLRYLDWFRRYLSVADEFAWECYKPAQEAAGPEAAAALRGAPLVFLSGDFSPFTDPRETEFTVEEVSGMMDSEEFRTFLHSLPIPVIGVPWYQVSHLPDVVLIAHEVAHDVEVDFQLTSTIKSHLQQVLAGMDSYTGYAWKLWLGEVWADLYAVLAVGPAFVAAMMDLLVADPVQIAVETKAPSPWDPHPPASLRVRLMTEALRSTGFQKDADRLWSAWQASFPGVEADAFRDVARDVVAALLAGRYPKLGDRTLSEVLAFSRKMQDDAEAVRAAALEDITPGVPNIRCIVAAARLAFDCDPSSYTSAEEREKSPQGWILERALETIDDKPRATEFEERSVSPEKDRKAGADLLERLEALMARREE
jgi:hypothetical protein